MNTLTLHKLKFPVLSTIIIIIILVTSSPLAIASNHYPVKATISSSMNNLGAIKLRRIIFSGTKKSGKDILKRSSGLIEGELYSVENLISAMDTLTHRMRETEGYPFFSVHDLNFEFSKDSSRVSIRIDIDEGQETVVDTVEIYGALGGRKIEVMELLSIKTGSRFDPSQWQDDIGTVIQHFERSGYPFVEVVTMPLVPTYRENEVGVRLGMKITPGQSVIINDLTFDGLEKTRKKTAERILGYKKGGRYNPDVAEMGGRKLYRTGWFSDVQEHQLFRNNNGEYGLYYTVAERPTSIISGAMGYVPDQGQDDGGLAGSVEAKFSNLVGTGRELEINWRRDSDSQRSFFISYREPYLFNKPFDLSADFSEEAIESLYVSLDYGIGLTWHAGYTLDIGISARNREISADSLAGISAISGGRVDSTSYSMMGLTGFIEIDTRDNPFNPADGGFYKIYSSRYVTNDHISFNNLYRNGIDIEQSIPVRGDWIGYAGVHAEETHVDEGYPPFAEWTKFGGAGSVRGYSERSLAAQRAGWSNLELRRVVGPDSRAFSHIDITVIDQPGDTFWKWSYGIGVQVDTGVGIITSIFSLPGEENLSSAIVHFQVLARF